MIPIPDEREAMLTALATREGEAWATSWFESLRREGRRVAGGWPGTLREARARVAHTARDHRMSAAEIETAAKAAYVAARKAWAAYAEPDED